MHRNKAGQDYSDYSNWLGLMQSGLRAVAGVVGQFRESQVCQVLRYRQHHNLVPLSNFLYLQMSAPWDELSGHMWEWAARPRQSGLLSSAQIRNCFCLQEAALSSGGGGWVARVSLQWDNMSYIPQQPPQPPAIINKPDQDLYPVLHRQSVSQPRT